MKIHKIIVFSAMLLLLSVSGFAQSGGNDFTFNPGGFGPGEGANNGVYSTVVQTDGKILVGGWFTSFNGTLCNRITRLNLDGTIDATFNPGSGPNEEIQTISVQTDGKIIIGGWFTSFNGTPINYLARLNSDGSLDPTFNIGTGANSLVVTSAIQPDGKILIGGMFSQFDGQNKSYFTRLNTDGSLDNTFNPVSGPNGYVNGLALQSDGKIIICGQFSTYNGTTRKSVARINTDGTLETTFNSFYGANSSVNSVAIQSDGKVVICGNFTTYGTIARNRIARINIDGLNDNTFNPGTGLNVEARKLFLQSDGKIVVGGSFTNYNGTTRTRIVRINSNGSLDTSFDPGTGANNVIHHVALQTDGKIMIGGGFTSFNGAVKNRIARLNSDGSLDAIGPNNILFATTLQNDGKIIIAGDFTNYIETGINRIARLNDNGSLDQTFNPGTGANATVLETVVQVDSKIIIGGTFTSYNGSAVNRIARINPNGSLDASFNLGSAADNTIQSLALQPDGKIIIGGDFTTYNGTSRNRIARLNIDGTLDPTFNPGTGTSGSVVAIVVQSDGKIVIAGVFSTYNGSIVNNICRLNNDGSIDGSFNSGLGADNTIWAVALQTDGKILIGGQLTSINGVSSFRIARLNQNGSHDPSFNIGTGANSTIHNILLQPDGKVIIGGQFTTFNGNNINRLARLNTNGSLDLSFNTGIGANSWIYASALQTDGKVIIAGDFLSYAGMGRNRVARVFAYCNPPAAPMGAATQTFCNTGTVADLTTVGSNIQWYANSTGGTALSGGTILSNSSTYYASQTSGGCESTNRLSVTISIDVPAAPTGISNQSFCNSATVANLTAIGTGIQWFATSSGGTALTSGTALTTGSTYYASQSNNGCESIGRLAVNVIINTPAAPSGESAQSFCGSITLAGLSVTGSTISWYNASSGSSVLSSSTNAVNGVTYYSSQTINGCESTNRQAVQVLINTIPTAPTGSATQSFCNSGTVADLSVVGSNFQWYVSSTGGTALNSVTVLTTGATYYASQTISGCESVTRLAVNVTINAPAAPTGSAAQEFCNSATISDLVVTGSNLNWYASVISSSPLATSTSLINGAAYFASQTINGCESSNRLVVNVTVNTPSAPIGNSNQNFCGTALISDIAISGSNLTWYDASTTGNILAPTTSMINGTTYYASQTINGCTSLNKLAVTVSINTIPPAPIGTASQEFCNSATIANLVVTGTTLKYYDNALSSNQLSNTTVLINGSTYFVSQSNAGCESSNRLAITAIINSIIPPSGNSIQNFCSAATVNDLNAVGSSITWYSSVSGGTPLVGNTALSNGTYYASQTINGCESINRLAVIVSVTILNATVTQTGITLTSAQSGANYTWLDCNNGNQPISGLNGQSFIPTTNGSYALEISLNSCSATSNCFQINSLVLEELNLNVLTVQPNPTNGILKVLVSKPTSAIITSSNGVEIVNIKLNGEFLLDTSNYATGIYFIRTDDGQVTKLIKN